MSNKERLERIERQLRLWGIDRLTKKGIEYWEQEITWLIQQSEKLELTQKIFKEQFEHDHNLVMSMQNEIKELLETNGLLGKQVFTYMEYWEKEKEKVKQLNSEILEWKFALDEATFDKNKYEQTLNEIEVKAKLYNEKGWALNADVVLDIIRKSSEVV